MQTYIQKHRRKLYRFYGVASAIINHHQPKVHNTFTKSDFSIKMNQKTKVISPLLPP